MSKYHANCTKGNTDKPDKCCEAGPPLTSKPFCDCDICRCKKCPDILKLLCISVTENSCDFGSKVAKETKNPTCSGHDLGQHQSLLAVLNPDKDCTCEIVARAVRSHLHMNLTMSEKREAIKTNSEKSSEDTPKGK